VLIGENFAFDYVTSVIASRAWRTPVSAIQLLNSALRNTLQNLARTSVKLATRESLVNTIASTALSPASAAWISSRIKSRRTHTPSLFAAGLAFGIAGAILGLILYSGFSIITGIEIGYVALAVGWLIAKAIKMGSRGIGGRRYQVAAVALTYAAVSMSAIPIYFAQLNKEEIQKSSRTEPAPSANPGAATPSEGSSPSTANTPSPTDKPKVNLLKALGLLMALGLASPFLELENPLTGALGLLILFVGMNIAWRLTAGPKIEILGPFAVSASAPPAT
jgi:hypothetical protein